MDVRFTLSTWRRITDSVYTAVATPDDVTIGLVIGDDGCLIIDTGSSPHQGRAIRESIASVTDVPLAGVVVTHGHRDHWFGLAAFTDVPSWGHQSLVQLRESGDINADLDRLGLTREDIVVPSVPLAVAAGVNLGNLWVEIAQFGPGHSPSDLVVVIAAQKVIFTGDAVESVPDSQGRPAPWYGPDSDPKQWAEAVDGIVTGMQSGSWTAICGHGDPVGLDEVVFHRGAHSMVLYQIQQLGARGVPVSEAATAGQWPWDYERVAAGVEAWLPKLAVPFDPPRSQLPLID